MNKIKAMLLIAFPVFAFSQDVVFEDAIIKQIPSNQNKNKLKSVAISQIQVSSQVKNMLASRLKQPKIKPSFSIFSSLPAKVQLGMNGVPVLDQGVHGTCATFAITAALDAISNTKTDYYSQLCPLSLGLYLEENSFASNGWNGATIHGLLNFYDTFGLVTKANESSYGCGGMNAYPLMSNTKPMPMSIEDYHRIAEPMYYSNASDYSILFDFNSWAKKYAANDLINKVKSELNYGNRVVIGVLVPNTDYLGLNASNKAEHDTWTLTPQIEQALQMLSFIFTNFGGHAMVITGYDDNAIVVDEQGQQHKGLFTLRNSWGTDVGDQGDFYMSYDYFNLLTIELASILKLNLQM